jgi:hypothetical protein
MARRLCTRTSITMQTRSEGRFETATNPATERKPQEPQCLNGVESILLGSMVLFIMGRVQGLLRPFGVAFVVLVGRDHTCACVVYKAILPPFCLCSILEQERHEPQNSRTCHVLHRRVASTMNTNKDLEQVFI